MSIRLLSSVLILIFLLSACQFTSKQDESRTNEVKQLSNQTENPVIDHELASHLAKIASQVPNVAAASALVIGPYAIVMIDVDSKLDRARVGTIKYSVSEALQHDPDGKEAIIIADADYKERIIGMQEKIAAGYPLQGIMDELAAIIGRYMPDYPVKEAPPVKEEQENNLPRKENHDIENIQEKQIID